MEFTPQDLHAYISDTLVQEILYWSLSIDATSDVTGIPDHLIEVQIDDVTGFTAPEDFVISLDASGIDGNLIEGFIYPFTKLQTNLSKYWRVRNLFTIDPTATDPSGITDWSDYSTFTIFSNDATAIADTMLENIPDESVYKKDTRDTNMYQWLNTYGNELDKLAFETFLTQTDLNLNDVRDSRIFSIFGYLFDIRKVTLLTYPEYKELLKLLTDLSFYGGTFKAINDICRFFTGVDPVITLIRDLGNVVTIGSDPTGDLYDVTGSFIEDPASGIFADYIWFECELAVSFTIALNNKYNLTLDTDLIRFILNLYKPGNSKIYILGL